MIPQRNVPICIILSIVTCGIYGLYWYVCLTNETDAVTQEPGPGGGMSLLLSLVTCGIYNIYWGWKMGDKLDASRARHGAGCLGRCPQSAVNRPAPRDKSRGAFLFCPGRFL